MCGVILPPHNSRIIWRWLLISLQQYNRPGVDSCQYLSPAPVLPPTFIFLLLLVKRFLFQTDSSLSYWRREKGQYPYKNDLIDFLQVMDIKEITTDWSTPRDWINLNRFWTDTDGLITSNSDKLRIIGKKFSTRDWSTVCFICRQIPRV